MGHGASMLASTDQQQQAEQLPVAEVAYEGKSLIKKVSLVFHYVCKGESGSFDEFCLSCLSEPFFTQVAERFLTAIAIKNGSQAKFLAKSSVHELVDIIRLHVGKYPNIYFLAHSPAIALEECRYSMFSFFNNVIHFELLIHDHYQELGSVFNISNQLEAQNPLLPMLDLSVDVDEGMLGHGSNYSRLKAYLTAFGLISPESSWHALRIDFPMVIKNLFDIIQASGLPSQVFFAMLRVHKARFHVNKIYKLFEPLLERIKKGESISVAKVIQTYVIQEFIKKNPAASALVVFFAMSSVKVTEDVLKTFLLKLESMAADQLALPKSFNCLRKGACKKGIIKARLVEYGFLNRMGQNILELGSNPVFKMLKPLLTTDEAIGLEENERNFFKMESPKPSPASPKAQSHLPEPGELSSLPISAVRLHFRDPAAASQEAVNQDRELSTLGC